jgi:hypothetical protein
MINPDALRLVPQAIDFVRHFVASCDGVHHRLW